MPDSFGGGARERWKKLRLACCHQHWFLFNLMRVKGPAPTGGCENPSPSVAQLSIPAERQDWLRGPGCISSGCQGLLAFSRNTAHQPSGKGSAAKVAGFPPRQTGVCVRMESSAASSFTDNMHFHACELWRCSRCKGTNGWSKLVPLAPVWYSAQPSDAETRALP